MSGKLNWERAAERDRGRARGVRQAPMGPIEPPLDHHDPAYEQIAELRRRVKEARRKEAERLGWEEQRARLDARKGHKPSR